MIIRDLITFELMYSVNIYIILDVIFLSFILFNPSLLI